jgi:hypothetical protein
LAGLKGIEPIVDEVLIVGCVDTDKEAECDHDVKLLALREHCRSVNFFGVAPPSSQFLPENIP